MKCPKCDKEGLKYDEPRRDENKKSVKRTNFHAQCKKCGWEGNA